MIIELKIPHRLVMDPSQRHRATYSSPLLCGDAGVNKPLALPVI